MIEGQGHVDPPGIEGPCLPGVIGALRGSPSPGDEDRRNGMEARVPVRFGIDMELPEVLDVERGLFPGLPSGCRFERLAVIDEPSRQGPPGRRVPPLDENDRGVFPAAVDLDDDVDGRHGVPELLAGLHGLGRTRLL